MRSAGIGSSANTLIHPCQQNLACRNLLRSGEPQGQCLTKHDIADENLEDIRARLENSPRKSLRWLSQQIGVSVGSASRATKLIKFRPYTVRVVYELKPVDAPQRIRFCNWMLKNVHDGLVDPQLLFIADEAYFHLSGYVNSQNTRIWSGENPRSVH
jgi:hypothetical protein